MDLYSNPWNLRLVANILVIFGGFLCKLDDMQDFQTLLGLTKYANCAVQMMSFEVQSLWQLSYKFTNDLETFSNSSLSAESLETAMTVLSKLGTREAWDHVWDHVNIPKFGLKTSEPDGFLKIS